MHSYRCGQLLGDSPAEDGVRGDESTPQVMWAQVGAREEDSSLDAVVSTKGLDVIQQLSWVHRLVASLRCRMVLYKYAKLEFLNDNLYLNDQLIY